MDKTMVNKICDSKKVPTVSVIMSCYNASDYVAKAIESVIEQTFTDFELILIDDGSEDKTLDIIKNYAAQDSRIVVIEKRNTGLTDSLNIGIQASRGEWIARLDADDLSMPTRLDEQISFLRKSPDILLVGSDFVEIDQDGAFVTNQHYPTSHKPLVNNLQNLKKFFPHSSAMFKAEIVKSLGGYNPAIKCAEDWDLWLRLAERGKIACLSKPLVKIRKHSQQVSHVEGGYRQALHGIAASVCHFLRCRGGVDPSTIEIEAEWVSFIEWLEIRVKQEKFFEHQQEWAQLRREYYFAYNKILGVLSLLVGLIVSKSLFYILKNKLFGVDLPIKLANEWCRKQRISQHNTHILL